MIRNNKKVKRNQILRINLHEERIEEHRGDQSVISQKRVILSRIPGSYVPRRIEIM